MNRASFSNIFRRLVLVVAVLITLAMLYVLSSAPASAWVANTVSGVTPAELNPSRYDQRLSTYWRFYQPVLDLRMWLRVHTGAKSESVFYHYEKLFHRPRKLADGREVVSLSFLSSDLQPGETGTEFLRRVMAAEEHTLDPRTEAYFLPRTGHMLLVLDPKDTKAESVIRPICYITSSAFAELQLP